MPKLGMLRIGPFLIFATGFIIALVGTLYLTGKGARDAEIRRLQAAIDRLETERRIAVVEVLNQAKDKEGMLRTTYRFTETSPGKAPYHVDHEIQGDVAYFDSLVVKFHYAYTRLGDKSKGKSLYLFQRTFGEHEKPVDGKALDPSDSQGVPAAYQTEARPSHFEREIWKDFWKLALDPEHAARSGVRVAHGEAVYTKLEKGKLYRLTMADAGGLSIAVVKH